jgi:peptide/nickel transport system substrate-binding protein
VVPGLSVKVTWDPTAYITGVKNEMFRCCLMRTLYSYDGHPAAEGGTTARPDLAVAAPQVSSDGLTWTIQMREGIRYAPPWDQREIVSTDVVEAIDRLARLQRLSQDHPRLVMHQLPPQGLAQYFSVIEGFDAVVEGKSTTVSGLRTPDAHTLEVHLERPAGDLVDRLAQSAAAPIPPGSADGHDAEFIRFLPASGPYMLEGSEALHPDLPPRRQGPISGWGPSLTFVRNPSWDPQADPLRAAYPDRIRFIDISKDPAHVDRRLLALFEDGLIDTWGNPAASVVRQVQQGAIGGRAVAERVNLMHYVAMNVAQPPFDDRHVRRALNLAIDRAAFSEDVTPVSPIWHLAPGSVEGERISDDWRPSWAAGASNAGNSARARREMARSVYDTDGDGRCDGSVCRVRTSTIEDFAPEIPIVRRALRAIGIHLDMRVVSGRAFVLATGRPRAQTPFVLQDWVSDYPNASSTFLPLFYGPNILEAVNQNYALLGASRAQLRDWGYAVDRVRSVDDRVERCIEMTGTEQAKCWVQLDMFLSQKIVPWVVIGQGNQTRLLSDRVVAYSFDDSQGMPSYDRIALAPGSGDPS